MKLWKWFVGHHVIAPRHPGSLPHIALGAHLHPPSPFDPGLLIPLVGAVVLTAALFTLVLRRPI